MLKPSLITSSSLLPLSSIKRHLLAFPDCRFDLFAYRDVDIEEIHLQLAPDITALSAQTLLQHKDAAAATCQWVSQAIGADRAAHPVAALATFFPSISVRGAQTTSGATPHAGERTEAIDAIVSCVLVTIALKEAKLAESAVVEIVCGSRLAFCECKSCKAIASATATDDTEREIGFVYTVEDSIRHVLDALKDVVRKVSQHNLPQGTTWGLALEFEPGDWYTLGTRQSLDMLYTLLDKPEYASLRPYVGLNIDIGHMRIAEIDSSYFSDQAKRDRVVHSHISDNPRMHTRDMPLGMWSPLDDECGFDLEYLRLLNGIAGEAVNRESKLPFSGYVALELEGCTRPQWVVQGVSALTYLLSQVNS